MEKYFLKNFFPTLYKYMMGIYKLYHFDQYYKDLSLLFKKIALYLNRYTLKGFEKLLELEIVEGFSRLFLV